jgi:biotin carboxylase
MNVVYLSPHFPPNYQQFCIELRQLGATVLGIADEPYEHLSPELRGVLAEYYKVSNLHNYDELLRAIGYFTHGYGKIDRLDSLNEYWLETEAALRTDFNIPGLKTIDMPRIKRKSQMKQTFIKAGIPVARGKVVATLKEAERLIKQIGYPVVAKPDIGVGAAKTYKIHNAEELQAFFLSKPPVDYIMEEFIQGMICSFDGLTDRNGVPVFYTAHEYSQGIMETVNDDALVYYYSLRQIPPDLEDAGMRALKAFDVRERFFHLEFFRTLSDNCIVALEVNIRPPGGMTTDMFNFANDINIYHEWAELLVNNRFSAAYSRAYHCAYIGRKFNRSYAYTHGQVLSAFGPKIVHSEQVSGIFSAALGDFGYLVRSPDIQEIYAMASYIQELA